MHNTLIVRWLIGTLCSTAASGLPFTRLCGANFTPENTIW